MENKNLSKIKTFDLKIFNVFLGALFSILVAFLLAGLVVLISGGDPINVYGTLLKGAFGSLTGLNNTFRFTLPIIFLALSFSITSRCGLFNIGQDGQLVASALAVVSISVFFTDLSDTTQILLMVLSGALLGALVAFIPAIFKIWLGINEVIIAILLNYLLLYFSSYLLTYTKLGDPNSSTVMSNPIGQSLSSTIIIVTAIVVIFGYALTLKNTVPGFHLRMVGKNNQFAKSSGIRSVKVTLIVTLIGGALSGLVAVGELLGVYHIMYDGFVNGMGNNGIMAAIIGQNSPVGMVFSSLVLGSLQSGSVLLPVRTDVPAEIVLVIQGFVMLFATIDFNRLLKKLRGRINGSL